MGKCIISMKNDSGTASSQENFVLSHLSLILLKTDFIGWGFYVIMPK